MQSIVQSMPLKVSRKERELPPEVPKLKAQNDRQKMVSDGSNHLCDTDDFVNFASFSLNYTGLRIKCPAPRP